MTPVARGIVVGAWLTLVGGCDVIFPLTAPPLSDAGPSIDSSRCFGTGLVTGCLDADPDPTFIAVVASETRVDTSMFPCAGYSGQSAKLCIIAADSIVINGDLRGFGNKSLVLVGTTITIVSGGSVDVSSSRVGTGAGEVGNCGFGSATGQGGGPGGSFGGRGGDGGAANSTNGVAGPPMVPTDLRGGCRGGSGGSASSNFGHGGGAVFLIAHTSITIEGTINASGARGQGGTPDVGTGGDGGGGGGSGGMIGLDAPMIVVSASGILLANGGGGGEGGGSTGTGCDGKDPDPTLPNDAALGGMDGGQPAGCGAMTAGIGGPGSAGETLDGDFGLSSNTGGGAGGGGGGAGIIEVFPPRALGGSVSPAPM